VYPPGTVVVPPNVVTTTVLVKAPAPAGTVTESWVSEITVGVAELPLNDTSNAVRRLDPKIETVLPPDVGPEFGEMDVAEGGLR
jgi:hypothetical protein